MKHIRVLIDAPVLRNWYKTPSKFYLNVYMDPLSFFLYSPIKIFSRLFERDPYPVVFFRSFTVTQFLSLRSSLFLFPVKISFILILQWKPKSRNKSRLYLFLKLRTSLRIFVIRTLKRVCLFERRSYGRTLLWFFATILFLLNVFIINSWKNQLERRL